MAKNEIQSCHKVMERNHQHLCASIVDELLMFESIVKNVTQRCVSLNILLKKAESNSVI